MIAVRRLARHAARYLSPCAALAPAIALASVNAAKPDDAITGFRLDGQEVFRPQAANTQPKIAS